jgi:hypothetical protein
MTLSSVDASFQAEFSGIFPMDNVVPEPASASLLGISAVSLLLSGRRKKSAA